MHLPDFIGDLAIMMISAGIITIIFKWLKQPIVLGYIIAGFLASPYITWLPTVSDMENVNTWAEIGIIILLFALGLEFSFKKLMAVGGTATIATSFNLSIRFIVGYAVGQFLDWDQLNSLFLGGMLCMSSTTIIIKAFKDMGLEKQKFAGIVFGMLIVEDLAAIVMMVLLSTLAVSRHFEGAELVDSILKLLFFILMWFVVGIYLIPTMLKKLKRYLNDETLLIVSIGLCLGMVLFATAIGFSAALGAFIMGSILAETIEAKHIEHLIEPLKNLFGAVFFVSVGMLIEPEIIQNNIALIGILSFVVIVGGTLSASLGVLASGQGLKVAIQSGFSLAQIGEFSFIIATLGLSLGVLNATVYPIIIAVSVVTTFTTPYMMKLAIPVSDLLEKQVPFSWNKLIKGYAASSYKTVNKQNEWKKFLKSIVALVVIYFTISLAILFAANRFINPFIIQHIPTIWGSVIAAAVTLVLMGPFLRAIIMKRNRSEAFRNLWDDDKRYNKTALISLVAIRVILCVILVLMVLIPLFPKLTVLMVIIALVVVTFIVFSQGFKKQSRKMELRFLENFNQKQIMDEKKIAILPNVAEDLLSKNIHIEEIEILQSSPSIGKTLGELNFRQTTGVNIISIIRGNTKINIPDAEERLYPFDKIIVSGSDEELQKLIQSLEDRRHQRAMGDEDPQYHISLSQYVVESNSPMIGKTIKDLAIRERTECMIIGVDRASQSIINMLSNFIFEEGDIVWLAAEDKKLSSFENNLKV